MKDKMNISRGRERDRTARQVHSNRLVGVINVDWKMQMPQTSDGLTPSGPRWYQATTSTFIHFLHHYFIRMGTGYQNTYQQQARK